ncbi:MAG TPA: hypothetical protein VGU45_10610 [Microvirga sp.]|jgi:hypothetical protein|nr:hypothetical protein [Microvirga sp.]
MGASRRFNLFRRVAEPDILCAVPEDRPVPPFVVPPAWEYTGHINRDSSRSDTFDTRAVASAIRFNGFYLLHRSRIAGQAIVGRQH